MQYLNKIIQGDCLEIMPQIPDKSVDMILCDLPYGVMSRSQNNWDCVIPLEPLWANYNRVIKDNGAIVLTATQPFASQLIASNPKMFKYDLIWVKNKVSGHLNAKKMPLRQHEHILVFYKKPPTYNPQKTIGHKPVHGWRHNQDNGSVYGEGKIGTEGGGSTERYPTSILEFPVINNDDPGKIHPTQKSLSLWEWLIKTYSNENEIILDNCAGGFTTAVACENLKRNWICIEKEDSYCRLGENRIKYEQRNRPVDWEKNLPSSVVQSVV